MILGVILLSLCKNIGTIFYMVITKSYIETRNWYHINILKRNRIKIKRKQNKSQRITQVSISETQKCKKNSKGSSSNSHSSNQIKHQEVPKTDRNISKRRKTVVVINQNKSVFEEPKILDNKKPNNQLHKDNKPNRNRRRNTVQVSNFIFYEVQNYDIV